MKTALITGVTGQDGSYLAELLAKGYRVVGVVRRSSSFNTARIDHLIDREGFSGKDQICKMRIAWQTFCSNMRRMRFIIWQLKATWESVLISPNTRWMLDY